MFTNQDLKKLIIPLFLEQLLVALVGIADVFVIGFVGEAAVSGVSLVGGLAVRWCTGQCVQKVMRLMLSKVEDDVPENDGDFNFSDFESFGKTSTTMYLSIESNVINVVGNCIGVFALQVRRCGSLMRIFSAAVITVLCLSKRNPVQYLKEWIFKVDLSYPQ